MAKREAGFLGEPAPQKTRKRTTKPKPKKVNLLDNPNADTEVEVVMVVWNDAMGVPGWNSDADNIIGSLKNDRALTIGMLVHEDETAIYVAQSVMRTDGGGVQHGDLMKIPKGMIDTHATVLSAKVKVRAND